MIPEPNPKQPIGENTLRITHCKTGALCNEFAIIRTSDPKDSFCFTYITMYAKLDEHTPDQLILRTKRHDVPQAHLSISRIIGEIPGKYCWVMTLKVNGDPPEIIQDATPKLVEAKLKKFFY
jgi:hypothetical protein